MIAAALAAMAIAPAPAPALPRGADKAQPASTARPASAFPAQVWARVPFEPTAFPSMGDSHLLYELYLTNFGRVAVPLNGVDVLDANVADGRPLASFTGRSLDATMQPAGADPYINGDGSPYSIPAGATLTLFLEVTIPHGRPVPERLIHRIGVGNAIVEGAAIGTHHSRLRVLGPPVGGTDWLAADGPGNGRDNHHRRGIFIRDGQLTDSRRLATDWKMIVNGQSFAGNEHVAASYLAYGRPVLAVADATVVSARDGLPDNPPGHGADFHPAIPVTIDNVGGNSIVLDLGNGEFAHYFHLRPGSLRVRIGDHVRRGQVIAAIGASGDAREPHLHFEVTTAARLLSGEGIPYVIDHYRVSANPGGATGIRERELPQDGMVIDFGH